MPDSKLLASSIAEIMKKLPYFWELHIDSHGYGVHFYDEPW